MGTLYKYCDQLGIVKILGALELKLPYISEVNDPYECSASFECKGDVPTYRTRYMSALKRLKIPASEDYEKRLQEQFEDGAIQKGLKEALQRHQATWNKRCCLISVSKTAQNTVMWAHYADEHKGVVIGVNFDEVFPNTSKVRGIVMNPVEYSKKRPVIDILADPDGVVIRNQYLKMLSTKSTDWSYEKEFRTQILDSELNKWQEQGFVCFREFNGKKSWFLRLNPLSIKEIIFGLYTEDSLKLAIKKLKDCPELQHIKLYQTIESEAYDLNLIEYGK